MTARPHRMPAVVLVALLVAALSALVAPSASAAGGTYLRLAHLSPDTPPVDVVVTSFTGATSELQGVAYGDVSSYKQIEPGTYTVQMRPAGEPDAPPIVTGTLDAEAGGAYTAAGLGDRAEIAVNVLVDDLTPPPPGQARVRVVQGAAAADQVRVDWNGAPVLDVAFGTATSYVTVPAGTGEFTVVPTAGDPARIGVELAAGGVYSVVVVERDGGLAGELRTDALGPDVAPEGGIDTGLGGTAEPDVPDAALSAVAAGLLVCTTVGLGVRRRAHRR
ncbi:DUF4397 domain-containing protein [Pseudonocardia broussonetiae]|uniref:DUF4397 domain-containing protein n=1 Tax=Pseudonocardia broussonetiae TaxID=2736640 RepID=A0A6M6JQ84_9PSEU|nr:DUF4397 domain-containing protein [Pseudonocardia broussonetiae]QJY49410.1 DUF4397 domain-containing protein [Pseudonocardia broussonetiae]